MTDATFKALTDVYGILLKAGWSKPMGRIDGDVAFNGVDEVGTIDGWRRECERLRQANQRLEAQVKLGHQCLAERDKEVCRLVAECEQLRQENEQLKTDSEAEFDSQGRRDLENENNALRIIINHMAPLL